VKKVPIDGTSFVIWDFPGFFDTGGPTNEIIHAAVLSKFMNDPLSSGMILMLTTQEPDLAASLCLTKPVQLTKSSYGKHIHSALTKKWEQVGSEFNNVVFDPFNKVKHKMTQKEMLDIFGRDNTHTGQV
jgi:hypothetical protein